MAEEAVLEETEQETAPVEETVEDPEVQAGAEGDETETAETEEAPDPERVAELLELDRQFRENPREVVLELARQAGIELDGGERKPSPEAETPDYAREAVEIAERHLGEQYGPILANRLAPIVTEIAESVVKRSLEPVEAKARMNEWEQTEKYLSEKYPDWKKHEGRMEELGRKFLPGKGKISMREYAEHLYHLASGNGKAVQNAVRKLTAAASKPAPEKGATDKQITRKMPETATSKDAFEAARKGIKWE